MAFHRRGTDQITSLYREGRTRLDLEDLMSTRDAAGGLEAFLAKRLEKWENR